MAKTEMSDSTKLQDTTTRLPMVDLETAIKFVTEIREKALETAAMPHVAVKLGYANATSTPFYRRLAAARLFKLVSQKASLTQEAIDYIKPHDEGTKRAVLERAIRGIPAYEDLITRYTGKKLNLHLVANGIAKDNKLSDPCAMICARAFEASLNFAGMITTDGDVQATIRAAEPAVGQKQPSDDTNVTANGNLERRREEEWPPIDGDANSQTHVIFLDKNKSRKFSFTGPIEITRAEYDRICKWLEFVILIEEGRPT